MTSKRRENINLVSFICLSFFSKQLLISKIVTVIFGSYLMIDLYRYI